MRSDLVDTGDPALPVREVRGERLTLRFLPTVGGRLISLEVDGEERLWRNPAFFDADLRAVRPRSAWAPIDGTFASWSNIGGSKSWPAPQGWGGPHEWAGPPDEILDAGEWSWAERPLADGLEISLTSPDDARTGLQITRRFRLRDAGTRFTQTIEHRAVGSTPVTWAPWEICQVSTVAGVGDARAGIHVAADGSCEPLRLGDWSGCAEVSRVSTGYRMPIQDVVAKRGFVDATGEVAWRDARGAGVRLSFRPDTAATYPDGGARVEIWMQAPLEVPIAELSGLHPDTHLAELEVLGPLRRLEPGTTDSLEIEWELFAAASPSAG